MLEPVKDFFISYTSTDQPWSEWIARSLEQVGFSVIFQARDFPTGSNFVHEMDKALTQAQHFIAVLSPAYINSEYAIAEWTAAFQRDPQGKVRRLVPVQVETCELGGLLGPIVYCDLVGCDEKKAHERLIEAVGGIQDHPIDVTFPGKPSRPTAPPPRFPRSLPPIWNVPYHRNPHFTGQDKWLIQLATTFKESQAMGHSQAQALIGLGGIGKTQVAVEYAYRYHNQYEAVLWVCADSHESLESSYIALAELLNLPEKGEQDQKVIIKAVKSWLEQNNSWLLIMDHANDLKPADDFLPLPFRGGHVLLTTRVHATGTQVLGIEMEPMSVEIGTQLLLRRSKRIDAHALFAGISSADMEAAQSICEELGGLPLALNQAGAYIEEFRCSLSYYLECYRKERTALLAIPPRSPVSNYPKEVLTTRSLFFKKVEEECAEAADLLRLCSFLHPDTIPLELITKGSSHLGPLLVPIATNNIDLNNTIAILIKYSLIRRDGEAFSIHRLVQAVIRDAMDEKTRKEWLERAVKVVNEAFPEVEPHVLSQCKHYLPHARSCSELVEEEKSVFPEAGRLLNRAGKYLVMQSEYAEAEHLIRQGLDIRQQRVPDEIADSLSTLGYCYYVQSRFADAEHNWRVALTIAESRLGVEHRSTVTVLNDLTELYKQQKEYEKAGSLYGWALASKTKRMGPGGPFITTTINTLISTLSDLALARNNLNNTQNDLALARNNLNNTQNDLVLARNNLNNTQNDLKLAHQGKTRAVVFFVILLILFTIIASICFYSQEQNSSTTKQALSAAYQSTIQAQGTAYQSTIQAQGTAYAQALSLNSAQAQSTIQAQGTAYAQAQGTIQAQQAPFPSAKERCGSYSLPTFLSQSDRPTVHTENTRSLFFAFLNCDPDASSFQLKCIPNSANRTDVCGWFLQRYVALSVPPYQAGVFFLQFTVPSDIRDDDYETDWQLYYGRSSPDNSLSGWWYITIQIRP